MQQRLNESLRLRKFFLFLLGAWIFFGYLQRDSQSWKWTGVTILIYALPFLTYWLRLKKCFYVTFWVAFFVWTQSLFSLGIYRDHATLWHNLYERIDYSKEPRRKNFDGVHTIRTDSKGYRTTHDVDYERKRGFRLFAIGASTTEEIYIDNQKTWTAQLEKSIPGSEVINTGLSGLLAIHHDDTLWAIERYHPDAAIFLMGINDWNKAIRQHYDPIHILPEPSRMALRKTMLGRSIRALLLEPDQFLAQYKGASKERRMGDLRNAPPRVHDWKTARTSVGRPETREYFPERASEEFVSALNRIAGHCKRSGIKCLWMTQPNGYKREVSEEYRKALWMTPPGEEQYNLSLASLEHIAGLYNKTLIQVGRDQGIPVCDLASYFQPGFDDFYDDCHFNPGGSSRVASIIHGCMKEIGWVQ